MLISSVFSILFATVCVIAMVSGILVLQNNRKSAVNKSYFTLMVAITVWAAGLAVATVAPDKTLSEIWRRFSAIGWGSAYAITLHFIILLTDIRIRRRKKLITVLLYVPALIMILAFALPMGINQHPYQLQLSKYGWVNVPRNDVWDMIFYAYYLSYTILGLFFLVKWGKKSNDKVSRQQARSITFAIFSSLLIGTITDIILSSTLEVFPQVAPIIMLIPIIAMYHSLKNNGVLTAEPVLKKMNYLSIVISVSLYLIISFFQARMAPGQDSQGLFELDESMVRGIITQMQMIISIFLVLKERKPGFIASVLINIWNLLSAVIFMIKHETTTALPGIMSYIGVLLLIFLIRSYMIKGVNFIERINAQNEKLVESEKTLYHMAYHDSLTGLPNKDSFFRHLPFMLSAAKRDNSHVGVLFIDFDSFKSVNDIAGHTTGDIVLQQISQRLFSCIGKKDMIARFAGDEFIIAVADKDGTKEIATICTDVLEIVNQPIAIYEMEYFVTASIGVAIYPEDGDGAETLVKNADMAMYAAKRLGKNQVVYCSPMMKEKITKESKLTNALYRALDKRELYLLYQPQVVVETKEIYGYEALLRWNNEDFGLINPEEFIPLAEKTGLIRPIGLWVLKSACQQLKLFKQLHSQDVFMSVNLSLLQLKDPAITKKIKNILDDTHTEAKNLKIEITEGDAFQDEPIIHRRLREIKDLGVSIAIDDFGTGYSSSIRLKNFPIDLLKIDIEFIRGISNNSEKDKALTKSLIQLGKNLGVKVLAEGVETEEQYQFLREQECDYIQGFYFYRPLSPDEILKILTLPRG
ncbi:MAG: EAL domain-containing protein [Sphaerochaetaceae bacterium]|nr:EAL domain-containing protein [Sphaerochaetaceae bacterium]